MHTKPIFRKAEKGPTIKAKQITKDVYILQEV